MESKKCCTGNNKTEWIIGNIKINNLNIPKISTSLTRKDKIGNVRVKWGINRMNYIIKPGVYAVGSPDKTSPVLVTANYKLTFDKLRCELSNLSAWILVLDTKGINVWCAAGKGTFGTNELINRIDNTNIKNLVEHKTLILPQLGATGVQAHVVKQSTGFKIKYGPVYSKDIVKYIKNNYRKTEEMKRIYFKLRDRLSVIPMEITEALPWLVIISVVLFIINCIGTGSINLFSIISVIPFVGTVIMGSVLVPILLPYIPFKSFALKGGSLGLIWVFLSSYFIYGLFTSELLINIILLPPMSAFLTLNLTGASTYTSLAGVKREVSIATPIMIAFAGIGIILKVLWIFSIL